MGQAKDDHSEKKSKVSRDNSSESETSKTYDPVRSIEELIDLAIRSVLDRDDK